MEKHRRAPLTSAVQTRRWGGLSCWRSIGGYLRLFAPFSEIFFSSRGNLPHREVLFGMAGQHLLTSCNAF